MWYSCVLYSLIPTYNPKSIKAKIKLYIFNGLCAIMMCVLMYRNLSTSESLTPEIVFKIVSLYVQILLTLYTIRNASMCCKRASGTNRKNIHPIVRIFDKSTISELPLWNQTKIVKLLNWIYWTLAFLFLIIINLLRLLSFPCILPENIVQICLCFIPMIIETHYCHMCIKFRNDYRNLNKLITANGLTTKKLWAVRSKRKKLNDQMKKMTGVYAAQISSEIATTAVVVVFKIHRVLRSTERLENTVSSATDLLDVSHRVIRLFALCKVSGDVANEANGIVTNLLNINPSTDKNLENEISFFLWEIGNPPLAVRLVYDTFVLNPRLFVSVFSWCVGFILILLQFRLPRTY